MRLSQGERAGILRAVGKLLPAAEVYLYGSRVNDTLKGGDVDLLILIPEEPISDSVESSAQVSFLS